MITLKPCKKNKKDAKTAFSWRNDIETILSAYISLPKTWDSFWLEYQEGYFFYKDCSPVFVMQDKTPVGFIRFEKTHIPECLNFPLIEIMINIGPEFRGKGIGHYALELVKKEMESKNYFALYAEIKEQNHASIKAFEKAGFELLKKRNEFIAKTQENCDILCYIYKT